MRMRGSCHGHKIRHSYGVNKEQCLLDKNNNLLFFYFIYFIVNLFQNLDETLLIVRVIMSQFMISSSQCLYLLKLNIQD